MTVKKILLTTLLGLILGSIGSSVSLAGEIEEVTTNAQVEFLNDAPKPSPPIPPEIKPEEQGKLESEKRPSDKLSSNDDNYKKPSGTASLDRESQKPKSNKWWRSSANDSELGKDRDDGKWLGNFPQTGELSSNKLLIFGLIILLIVGVLYIKNKKNKHRESY